MQTVIVKNNDFLPMLLDKKHIDFEVIQDGWKLRISFNDFNQLIEIGKLIGMYLPNANL